MAGDLKKKVMNYDECTNLGIVILLPFIQQLFELLDLLKEHQFKDDSARLKAIQLCHYLATGACAFRDQDVLFAKLLVGYELNDPIQIEAPLEVFEKQECIKLLESVIQYWQVLKSISIDGLRDAFLNRQGNIIVAENQYILKIESASVDLFLQNLPSYQLPWMKRIIMIEWHY